VTCINSVVGRWTWKSMARGMAWSSQRD